MVCTNVAVSNRGGIENSETKALKERSIIMKKLLIVVGTLLASGALAFAQNSTPRFDAFGGYSYFNGNTAGGANRFSLNGWNFQGTYNVNHWLGATADFGGYYGSPFNMGANNYSFLFGPTVSIPTARFTPFVHTLFGVDRSDAAVYGSTGSDNVFAMAIGGGVDAPIHSHLSLRLAQVDWLRSEHFSTDQNNLRVSTGIVFRFGE